MAEEQDAVKTKYIVTHMPIARQRLGKHIPQAYALKNRRQRINKHAFLKTEDMFSVVSVPRSYKRVKSVVVQIRIEGVQRSSVGSQNSSSGVSSR
jgi:hypothetical protein